MGVLRLGQKLVTHAAARRWLRCTRTYIRLPHADQVYTLPPVCAAGRESGSATIVWDVVDDRDEKIVTVSYVLITATVGDRLRVDTRRLLGLAATLLMRRPHW